MFSLTDIYQHKSSLSIEMICVIEQKQVFQMRINDENIIWPKLLTTITSELHLVSCFSDINNVNLYEKTLVREFKSLVRNKNMIDNKQKSHGETRLDLWRPSQQRTSESTNQSRFTIHWPKRHSSPLLCWPLHMMLTAHWIKFLDTCRTSQYIM